jgi:divalent metal cation (Fe/Co/Zn/Cd) transporter
VLMVYESKGLLIGEGLDPQSLKAIRGLVETDPAVERVRHLHTMYLGPHEVLLTIELSFDSNLSVGEMRKAIRGLVTTIRSRHPDVKQVFFGAESLSEDADISMGH